MATINFTDDKNFNISAFADYLELNNNVKLRARHEEFSSVGGLLPWSVLGNGLADFPFSGGAMDGEFDRELAQNQRYTLLRRTYDEGDDFDFEFDYCQRTADASGCIFLGFAKGDTNDAYLTPRNFAGIFQYSSNYDIQLRLYTTDRVCYYSLAYTVVADTWYTMVCDYDSGTRVFTMKVYTQGKGSLLATRTTTLGAGKSISLDRFAFLNYYANDFNSQFADSDNLLLTADYFANNPEVLLEEDKDTGKNYALYADGATIGVSAFVDGNVEPPNTSIKYRWRIDAGAWSGWCNTGQMNADAAAGLMNLSLGEKLYIVAQLNSNKSATPTLDGVALIYEKVVEARGENINLVSSSIQEFSDSKLVLPSSKIW